MAFGLFAGENDDEGVTRPTVLDPMLRTSGGPRYNAYRLQKTEIAVAMEVLGDAFWDYGLYSERRIPPHQKRLILQLVFERCRVLPNDRTFRRHMVHFIQYGELQIVTERSRKRKRRGNAHFSNEDSHALLLSLIHI